MSTVLFLKFSLYYNMAGSYSIVKKGVT